MITEIIMENNIKRNLEEQVVLMNVSPNWLIRV